MPRPYSDQPSDASFPDHLYVAIKSESPTWMEEYEAQQPTEPHVPSGSKEELNTEDVVLEPQTAETQTNVVDMTQETQETQDEPQPHINKPPNAFMLFLKEQRPHVNAEYERLDSATVIQILAERWHSMMDEEKAKYFHQAQEERQHHYELHPDWKPNYILKKKRVRTKKKTAEASDVEASKSEKTQVLSGSDRPRQIEKEEQGYIKKPPNAFMLFLKEKRADFEGTESVRVSMILGHKWRSMTQQEKEKYFEEARKERIRHNQLYPDWKPNKNPKKQKSDSVVTETRAEAAAAEESLQPTMARVPSGSEENPHPQTHHTASVLRRKKEKEVQPHIKKPLNAFMLFQKEQRPIVKTQHKVTDSITMSLFLTQKWKALTDQEKAKYFEEAQKERIRHHQLYPDWTPSSNWKKTASELQPRLKCLQENLTQTDQDRKKHL